MPRGAVPGGYRHATGFTCACAHPWRKHTRLGCRFKDCACRVRIIEWNQNGSMVRMVLEMPVKGA